MANIALTTANHVDVVESLEQMTLPAAEAITPGAPVRIVPSSTGAGQFTNANAQDAAEGRAYGMAVGQLPIAAGIPCTAIRRGVVSGFTLTSLDYGVSVFLSDTDGRINDTHGTVYMPVGIVIPMTHTVIGTAYEKAILLQFDHLAWLHAANSPIVVGSDLRATSVDADVFVADRAYQVLGFRETHSVVGGSGATVRPRKITDTSAPGAAASGTVKELTAAAIGLETTINTVVTPGLTATAADLLLAAGDRVALDFAGTLTGLVGQLTMFLRPV